MKRDGLVVDKLTGERKRPDELYKVTKVYPSGKKANYYYTNKEAYEQHVEDATYYRKCTDTIMDYIGYSSEMKFPTSFAKRLGELKGYGYKAVYYAIMKCSDDIRYALEHKEFKDEHNKFSYIFAIIENRILDVYKQLKTEKKKGYEAQPPVVDDLDSVGKRGQEHKDLSAFIGDL